MCHARSIGIVGAALAAVGLFELACARTTPDGVSGSPLDGGGARTNVDPDGGSLAAGNGAVDGDADGPDGDPDGDPGGSFLPCENPTPVVIAGKDTGFVQCAGNVLHRAKIATCPNALPRADAGTCTGAFGDNAQCSVDSDCTLQPYGTCGHGATPLISCVCSYGCVSDSDCAAGEICECGDPIGRCLAASCKSDTDCPHGSLCAAVQVGWGGCWWDHTVPSYACQARGDTCLASTSCDGGTPVCAYDPDGGVRECHPSYTACPIGRPFLVEGALRVAPAAPRGDWSAPLEDPAKGLSLETRARLAARWTRAGQMEHASIAAFARFTLELLALAAPPELVTGAQQAMAEETTHARLCFALASAYSGAPVGPGPLAMDGALGPLSAKATFATLVREGCIGETIAAVEAIEELADEESEPVKDVLRRIARDETSHAELAWRAARWLVASGDDAFRAWAEQEIARALAERAPGAALASETLRAIVEPCAARLFAAA